ncbi:MAG TPA: class I SAM-dependent methyltransferase [Gemmatimonadales bacterium]|nr:class I SAM-dependent methyltransferase [Gemmatimonadales bacterium]
MGCGPGTNAGMFPHARYLGVDLDPAYVKRATARFGPRFAVGDAAALDVKGFAPVDAMLVNSLCHHLTDDQLRSMLVRTELVAPGGYLHLIDLHLPGRGIPEYLARADRGEHPRSRLHLSGIVAERWEIDVEDPFWLTVAGVRLWAMVYIRAKPRS